MRIGILGAGAAGLSAAYLLRGGEHEVCVHEASAEPGGLARSFRWHGFDCDFAPHRLYTDSRETLAELGRLVPLRRVRRRSRIYVQGRWLREPLSAMQLLLKLPRQQAWNLMRSYLSRPQISDESFASLARGRFGEGLFELFFKPYSEKLFGIPAEEIAASWGRRKLRLGRPIFQWRRESRLHFRRFYYPRRGGYGAICGALYHAVKPAVRFESRLVALRPRHDGVFECTLSERSQTVTRDYDLVISSLPIPYVASLMGMATPLRFRALRLVYLLVDRPHVGADQWFYFADRDKIVNRVAEFKNFAADGAPADRTVLCCEITDLASFSLDRVLDDLRQPCALRDREVLDTKIVDIERAYPIYDRKYESDLAQCERFFAPYPGITHLGRSAQFVHQDVDEIFARAKTAITAICRHQSAAHRGGSPIGDALPDRSHS